jgi:hypothetical protein
MRRVIRPYVILLLMLTESSCSFLSKEEVSITIGSYPKDANIYVDDQLYGKTPSIINLIPDKDKVVTLKKSGWEDKGVTLKSVFSLRKDRTKEYRRCKLDLYGFIFIFPIVGLKSVHCYDFDSRSYYLEMNKGNSSLTREQARVPNTKSIAQINPHRVYKNKGTQTRQNKQYKYLNIMPAALKEERNTNNYLPKSNTNNNDNYHYW